MFSLSMPALAASKSSGLSVSAALITDNFLLSMAVAGNSGSGSGAEQMSELPTGILLSYPLSN
jgi:hypothetical protein